MLWSRLPGFVKSLGRRISSSRFEHGEQSEHGGHLLIVTYGFGQADVLVATVTIFVALLVVLLVVRKSRILPRWRCGPAA